jgi:WhiB family redox-sensing transcriptional regulator
MWRDDAACRKVKGINFFPVQPVGGAVTDLDYEQYTAMVNSCKRVCDSCPVLVECREYSIVNETEGIWGGLTPRERAYERGLRARKKPVWIEG